MYVHNLNPIALPIYHEFSLKWYGLAYLMGFVGGFLLLRNLAQRGMWVLKPEKTADFIAAAALFGVFMGGRIGWVLFYFKDGLLNPEWWPGIKADPFLVFRVWQGGMASHGGILGLVIFTWFYARKEKVTWTGLGDGLCVVAPLGLFFGRMANFVNGELYGRVVHGISWAMKFPGALMDGNAPEYDRFNDAAAAAVQVEPKLSAAYQALESASNQEFPYAKSNYFQALLDANRHSPKVSDAIAPYLEPRHPSQLYEGALEGLLLFTILYVVRVKFPKAPDGLLTGLFFAFYALFRIFGEQFREPDAALVGAFSRGQFFSFFMFAFAAAFFFHAWRGWKRQSL
ncbi:MAG: prolipoprotein diacylglyceryl transferase [Luteolibacter sp.]|uniref:prolipoprotein diacylglyceryl transferase n=1 Tax=Luteolibacter sp. TaxID=1962973 RepID=UPI00326603BC